MSKIHSKPSTFASILSWGTVVFGVVTVLAIWVMVTIATRSSAPYMALVVVFDVWLMMRFTSISAQKHWPWMVVILLICLWLAWHAFTATQLGLLFGVMPLDAIHMSSGALTYEHMMSAFGQWDAACLAAALVLIYGLSRSQPQKSAT